VKRLTARVPALVIALVALSAALGGSAYARSSSTATVPPARAKVNASAHRQQTLKAVTSEAKAAHAEIKPAAFTG